MKSISILILSFLFFTSCEYGTNFKLNNQTDRNIDSIIISNGFNSVKVNSIKPNEMENVFLDFKENNPKQDGLHIIQVFFKESSISQSFGYYSNGIPSANSYQLEIKNDTINIKRNQ